MNFIVSGADRDTGKPVKMLVRAETPHEAEERAYEDGVLVSSVTPEDSSVPVRVPASVSTRPASWKDRYSEILRSPEHKAMERAVRDGVVRGLLLYAIILFVVFVGCVFVVAAISRAH